MDSVSWARSLINDLDLYSGAMCAGDLEQALARDLKIIMRSRRFAEPASMIPTPQHAEGK
jgi:hypothetical protein